MKGDFTRWSFARGKHYHGVLKQQGRVGLDADWNEQQEIAAHRVESETIDVIGASGAPAGDAGFVISAANNGANLTISKGRAYVAGLLCENEADVLISAQPDLPNFQLPTTAGTYIAYLSVWLRHVIALDDDAIREDALGGPDTCTRARTVWQVNLLPAGAVGAAVTCTSDVAAWDTLVAPSSGTLAARAEPDPTASGPCTIPATAGYRRLENQLYRVEVHAPAPGTPTFKWSRDNGSVVTAWQGQSGNDLTVSSIGPDSVLGFAAGQWVELTDDNHELNFLPGTLVQLVKAQGTTLTINPATATGSVTFTDFPRNPKIRRWDSAGAVALSTGGWLALEDGVQVNFAAGTFATGDYWLIPARTLRANIDWPLDSNNNPVAAPPVGIARHYCRLALLSFNGTAWSVASQCLPTFPPLTQLTAGEDKAIHVTDVSLASPAGKIPNDSDVPILELLSAQDFSIIVTCDAPIDPASAQPTTCFVTVELPYPLNPVIETPLEKMIFGYQSLILPGIVKIGQASQIIWSLDLTHQTMPLLGNILKQMVQLYGTSRLLVRLTLKGDCIWGRDDASLHLDGQAFGAKRTDADSTTHIDLRLPSGDGKHASDFELWFWLLLPVGVSALAFAPDPVTAGQNSNGTVTLDGPAPAGGAAVTLTSVVLSSTGAQLSGVTVGTIPGSVTVPAGQTSAPPFTVTQTSVPDTATSVTLRVTAAYGGRNVTQDLTINRPVTLKSVTFPNNPNNQVAAGATATGTVTLGGLAPPGGASVSLSINNTQNGTFAGGAGSTTVVVQAGQTTAPFTVTASNHLAVSFTVTATLDTSTAQATLTIPGAT